VPVVEGIDKIFGISSHSGNVAGQDTSISVIAFAGVSSDLGEEGGEEIQLEAVRGDGSRQLFCLIDRQGKKTARHGVFIMNSVVTTCQDSLHYRMTLSVR
jgi:hypothetical protein